MMAVSLVTRLVASCDIVMAALCRFGGIVEMV